MVMSESIDDESDQLARELLGIVDVPRFDESVRVVTSDIACSLALEHWHAARLLLRNGLFPSAVVVHRAQFEAVLRSIWLLYAATNDMVAKLGATLSLDSEQSAKNMPLASVMMEQLSGRAPPQAVDALLRFKETSWKALNSYVHAGIHPIRRHGDGTPIKLLGDVLRNANVLAVLSCMQAAALSGQQHLQQKVLDLAAQHPTCMPPPLRQ